MIDECPVSIECKVMNKIDIDNMEMFIGEVIQSYVDEDCIEDGKPNALKIDPLIYDISNVYGSLGDWTSQPFKVGKNLIDTKER